MAHLHLDHITKRFGALTALDDIDLIVRDQEFMVLLGPTGAGKTTTLRCTAGLERPDEGRVVMDGADVTAVSPSERDVAFVFQNYALYPRKTVFQNISFPLEARTMRAAEIRTAVTRVTTLLHISHLHERLPAQLSGGEQQRVALARALVRQPRLFLMDEPLTNLDFKLRTQMRGELKRIQQDLQATFFYVTNDQIEALSMGDRVAVLNKGVLQQIGPPQEVYDRPANLFVAGFVGTTRMNFLPCAFDAANAALVADDQSWRLGLANGHAEALRARGRAGQLVLGIRPEDLALGGADGPLAGEVYVAEPLGDRNIYDIRVGRHLVKVKTPPTLQIPMGERVALTPNLHRVHLFDQASGAAIHRAPVEAT